MLVTADDKLMRLLVEIYQGAVCTNSDIMEHCLRLRELASKCIHVTEFGVRKGVSTAALLMGVTENDGEMVSYDKDPCYEANKIYQDFPNWRFIQGSSLKVDIALTDLLFIDTIHTGEHLGKELEKHSPSVAKWIAVHDTEAYRNRGDDGGEGMWPAIARFTLQHDNWKVKEHYPECYGLTVLERLGP